MNLPDDLERLLPLDKSWMIRMGMLDLQANSDQSLVFLRNHRTELGDDLLALLSVLESWKSEAQLDVGESGTLFRFVQYYCWLIGDPREIIRHGTLKNRELYSNPNVVKMNLSELLSLDGGTSQWASAAVLFGVLTLNREETIPYKLQTTVEALGHWRHAQETDEPWLPRVDETIRKQAAAYMDWRRTGKIEFAPEQAEDFLFACTFGLMTPKEGENSWPQLRNHESDRIVEMRRLLDSDVIDSADHRVVQALAMRFPQRKITERSKKAVNKTWPQFWAFLRLAQGL